MTRTTASIAEQKSANQPYRAAPFAVLAAAVFVVALGYGAILPTLPGLLGTWLGEASGGEVARYTGWLSGLYMFALFAFSPAWGALSDRIGRRPIILVGLAGYVGTLAAFHTFHTLPSLYANRVLAGAFASAVLPVTAAYISDLDSAEQRLRWFALTGAANSAGFLLGPALSGFMTDAAELNAVATFSLRNPAGLPVAAGAVLGALVWFAAYFVLPPPERRPALRAPRAEQRPFSRRLYALLGLTLLVMLGLATFEVGIALAGQQAMYISMAQVTVLFMLCSGVMAVVQALLFLRPSLQSTLARHLTITAGFVVLVAGFAWLSLSRHFYALLGAAVIIAAATGLLLPMLSQLISTHSGPRAGTTLGLQSSASSLGQGFGSVAGGWLFGWFAMSSFWLAAGVMAGGALLAANVARMRATPWR